MKPNFEINPLDVLEVRRFTYLPPHLTPHKIGVDIYNKTNIDQWIQENLNSRYYLGTITVLENNHISTQDVVSFEDSKELTIFFLSCPYLPKVS